MSLTMPGRLTHRRPTSTTTIEITVILHLDVNETSDLIPVLKDRQTQTHGSLDLIAGTLPDGRAATVILDPVTGGSVLLVELAPIAATAG